MKSLKKISQGQFKGKSGFIDYNDSATIVTPINIGTTYTNITNDGLGNDTQKEYAPKGVSDVYDVINNRFDFSDLKLGDMIHYRLNLTVTTTTANQELFFTTLLGLDNPPIVSYSSTNKYFQFKTSGTYPITIDSYFDMGNESTLNSFGNFYIKSNNSATLINHGVRFQITLY